MSYVAGVTTEDADMPKEETPDDVELAAYRALARIAKAVERIAKVLEELAEEEGRS